MSQENVEVVRRVYEAVARGDTAAVLAAYDPGVEWDFRGSPFRDVVRRDVYHGHDGIRSLIRERTQDAWADVEDHLEELIDAGDHVISVVTSRGRGLASGIKVERGSRGGMDDPVGHDRPGCVDGHAGGGPRSRGAAGVATIRG